MVADFQRRVVELRFIDGVEKVEHVPYATGDQFWVRLNRPLDRRRIEDIAKKHGMALVKFGGLPSKLPRPLAELLWDGVAYVISRGMSGWAKFFVSLGFEPEGVAKIVKDAHGPYQIFIATQEEGVQILYEYLGLKYTPPAPPPKPVATPKPTVSVAVKPVPQTPSPSSVGTPPKATPSTPPAASPPKPEEEIPPPKPGAQP